MSTANGGQPPADTRKIEPRNPFYFLLMAASLLFVITALLYWVVPIMEQKAADAGQPPPPSAFRDSLRSDGWKWMAYELAGMFLLALLSMGLDRFRRWQRERSEKIQHPS